MPTQPATNTKRYKIRNWSQHNAALVQRGSITFWFSEDIVRQWKHTNQYHRGRPYRYNNVVFETLLTLRELFQLPYRATEDFAKRMLDGDTQEIVATALTQNGVHDTVPASKMLDSVKSKLRKLSGDGAYDTRSMYDEFE